MSLDAFASLMADSICINLEVASTRATEDSRAAPNKHTRRQSARAGPAAAAAPPAAVDAAAAHRQQVDAAVEQLRAKVAREKAAREATEVAATKAAAVEERKQSTRRQYPLWRLQTQSPRPWTSHDSNHLSELLLATDDDACQCHVKRRRVSSSPSGAMSAGRRSDCCCCVERLEYASRTMRRSMEDIQEHLQEWKGGRTPVAAANAQDAAAASNSDRANPPSAAAAAAGAGASSATSALASSSLGPSPSTPFDLTSMSAWSDELIYELMTIVRAARDQLATERARIRQEQHASVDLVEVQPSVDGGPAVDFFHLPLSTWNRLAGQLHPPQAGELAYAVYRDALARGYRVPTAHLTQAAFYIPSQREYERESKFDYDGHHPRRDEDHDQPADDDDDAAADNESTSSRGDDGPPEPIDSHALLQQVRRLSKRYRR